MGESRLNDLSPGLSMKSKTRTPAEKTQLQRSRGHCIDAGMRSFAGLGGGAGRPARRSEGSPTPRAEPTAGGLDPAPERYHAS